MYCTRISSLKIHFQPTFQYRNIYRVLYAPILLTGRFAIVAVSRCLFKKKWPAARALALASMIDPLPLGPLKPLLQSLAPHVIALFVLGKLVEVATPDHARTLRLWRQLLPIWAAYMRTKLAADPAKMSPEQVEAAWTARHEWGADAVYEMILDMSGYYVKSAQILASKSDFMPSQWCTKLARLFDNMPPRSWAEVEATLEDELRCTALHRKHGATQLHERDVFERVAREPIAAASIAQVHMATLSEHVVPLLSHDTATWLAGHRDVVIKVQHRGMEKLMASDLRNIGRVAKFLKGVLPFDVTGIVREIQTQIPKEFDFVRERRMMEVIRGRLEASGAHPGVLIPRSVPELCTARQLVLEKMEGTPFTAVLPLCAEAAARAAREAVAAAQQQLHETKAPPSPSLASVPALRMLDLTPKRISRISMELATSPPAVKAASLPSNPLVTAALRAIDHLIDAMGQMMLRDGLFHGDCHPGNLLLDEREGRVVALDFGQCKALPAPMHRALCRMILALDDGDKAAVAEGLFEMGLQFGTESGRNGDLDAAFKIALVFFDLRFLPEASMSPFGNPVDNPLLAGAPISHFPSETYMIIRAMMLLRGICFTLGADIDTARRWRHYAEAALEGDWIERRAAENARVADGPTESEAPGPWN